MVYTNINFNLPRIFQKLKITEVDVPLTKKKKNVDKKKLKAPYGTIISVQKGINFRGIDLRKRKKHWCTANCRKTEQRGKKTVEICTVEERPRRIEGTDIYEIQYFCTDCEKYYTLKQLKKITNFLNQVTIVLSIEKVILNIMLFKDNFKIAGCKDDNDAVEVTMLLWQDYVRKIPEAYQLKEEAILKKESPLFTFRLVMRNVDFRLGFFIDREQLNMLMNSEKYSKRVYMSQCETTGHTNVNIKMYTDRPEGFKYDCLVFPENDSNNPYWTEYSEIPYMKVKKAKSKFTTFIVFSSSEIILSGRYNQNMKNTYEFFVKEVMKNRDKIEENINKPLTNLSSFLKKK